MKWWGDIAITKEFHFEQIMRGNDKIWFLGVKEQGTCFFLPIERVQQIAKQFNLKQVSMINKKLENRLIILTYDGFSCIHTLQLKSDYHGPKIPERGIERMLDLGKEKSVPNREKPARRKLF